LQKSFNVIPAGPVPEVSSPGAGIQVFQGPLDRGCHRSDGFVEFCKRLRIYRINRIGKNRYFQLLRPQSILFNPGFLRVLCDSAVNPYVALHSRLDLVLLVVATFCPAFVSPVSVAGGIWILGVW
jgi:hypothetical protein